MKGLFKVDVNTKLHIDMEWWKRQNKDFRLYLYNELCPECKEKYQDFTKAEAIDWIDPETAEVKQVDGLWHTLLSCCSLKPDYLSPDVPVTNAVFRVFLANGNTPLSAAELAERLNYPDPERLLRILTKGRVYNGIRPVMLNKKGKGG